MPQEWMKEIWTRHRGKLAGALAGFLLGLLMAAVGIFWAIVIFALTVGGFLLGRRFDEDQEGLSEWLERLWQDRR